MRRTITDLIRALEFAREHYGDIKVGVAIGDEILPLVAFNGVILDDDSTALVLCDRTADEKLCAVPADPSYREIGDDELASVVGVVPETEGTLTPPGPITADSIKPLGGAADE